mgnify:CR=1 FL=1
MTATMLHVLAPHICPQPDVNLGVRNSLNDRPVVMATLMSCHYYLTAGVLAVDYTEILRSLHEGGLVSDRAKREIESSAAITGWSCITHHFFCFTVLSHYAFFRSASKKQLSCIMIILI